MARPVTTLLSAVRTGTRVARYLIRPADAPRTLRHGGWDLAARARPAALPALHRAGSTARRTAGLGVLAVIGVIGASILALGVLFAGLGLASGSDAAGWVMGLLLLLGVLGAVWLARRAAALLRRAPPAPGTEVAPAELDTLAALYRDARALPAADRHAYRRALTATADALHACAADTTLGRDAFDARQAAREDLPELLHLNRDGPRGSAAQGEFTRQLALIEQRMHAITRERATQRARDLDAHGRYLDDKYGTRRPGRR